MQRRIRDFRTQEELTEYVNSIAWSESEDDEDFSSDDEQCYPDFNFNAAIRKKSVKDRVEESNLHNETMEQSNTLNIIEPNDTVDVNNFSSQNQNIAEISELNQDVVEDPVIVGDRSRWQEYATMFEGISIEKDSTVFKRPLWRKRHMQHYSNIIKFRGNDALSPEILALKSPLDFFSFFISDDIISNIVEQSNLYAVQKDIAKPLNTTPDEIKRFMGVNYYMSVFKYPSVRSYWSDYGFKPIMDCMTRNRHEKIRQFLHLNNNETMPRRQHFQDAADQQPSTSSGVARRSYGSIPQCDSGYDRLYKIRPVITALNRNFKKVPMRARLCVDEQICATKIKHYLKQYMPDKPHPWGDKLFLLCDDSGFCYSFEIYSGDDDHREENEPNLGASANVVVRLARSVPRFVNHVIFFDNYYTSVPLMVYLRTQGIYSIGTVRRPRLPLCKLSQKFANRGDSEEYVGTFHGIDVTTVAWNDNKVVTMASTMAGVKPYISSDGQTPKDTPTIERYNKKKKEMESIQCPNIVHEYNKYMGGVDLLDSSLGRSHIRIKSRKWTSRLFYHMCDIAIINAWILYKRHHVETNNVEPQKVLHEFVSEVAHCLTKSGTEIRMGKGRRSNLESEIIVKRPRPMCAALPPRDIRLDNIGHFPEFIKEGKPRFVICDVREPGGSSKNQPGIFDITQDIKG
ncbi:piggyBac transposable element-derived protein 3-like [Lucilia sericata]|uniref:piggyBac transposable element-derived protein 3-like n=1 Tax=Lucilia sericata TaxID=13632 RepID=UPI0018A7E9B1|nr:piggyBac transposable element-derived protein 3-like [Lucilia sericata]